MVIIGLIIGGVLVGNDLIYAANVRAQIAQIQDIETQINTFEVKYNCLPGDCANATDFFGTTSPQGDTIRNGDGDGIIKSMYNGVTQYPGDCITPTVSGEVSQLFMQLYLAGIGKNYTQGLLNTYYSHIATDYPYAKFGNGTGIFVTCLTYSSFPNFTPAFLQQGNVIVIGAAGAGGSSDTSQISLITGQVGIIWYGKYGMSRDQITYYNPIGIPTDAARRIDEKIDDGSPSTGKFGIIAGQTGCDNTANSYNNHAPTSLPLLTAYPASSVSCNATVGKLIK